MKRRVDEAEATLAECKQALVDAREASDSATRFFGKVQVPRVLAFDTIPADSMPKVDAAKAEARQGQWMMLMHPVKYVERRADHGAVTDAWVRTASLHPRDASVMPMWVRLLGEDNSTPAFSKLVWYPHD